MKPKARADLTLVEIDDDALVWDPEVNLAHYLNPSAKLVYQLFDGRATVGETASTIADAFGKPVEPVESDVRRLMRTFRKLNLLERKSGAVTTDAVLGEQWPVDERGRIRLEVRPSS